jgi:hypothetical protein
VIPPARDRCQAAARPELLSQVEEHRFGLSRQQRRRSSRHRRPPTGACDLSPAAADLAVDESIHACGSRGPPPPLNLYEH